MQLECNSIVRDGEWRFDFIESFGRNLFLVGHDFGSSANASHNGDNVPGFNLGKQKLGRYRERVGKDRQMLDGQVPIAAFEASDV